MLFLLRRKAWLLAFVPREGVHVISMRINPGRTFRGVLGGGLRIRLLLSGLGPGVWSGVVTRGGAARDKADDKRAAEHSTQDVDWATGEFWHSDTLQCFEIADVEIPVWTGN